MILDIIATCLLSLSIIYGIVIILSSFSDVDNSEEGKKAKIIVITFLLGLILANVIGIIAIWL